jgi:hypothetical protein
MLDHYGRTHAARGLRAVLGHEARDGMSVPVTTNASRQTGGGAALAEEVIICSPPRPKLSWLRRGALLAADLGLAWLRVP